MTSYSNMVKDVVAADLTPAFIDVGFTSARRGMAWRRQSRMEVRIVVDSKAKDAYRGGAFTLEFEVSSDGQFEHKLAGRARIDQLLDIQQKARFLDLRNTIAGRLVKPGEDYLNAIHESIRAEYLRPFVIADELEKRFWMRYVNAEDAQTWCILIRDVLSDVLPRAESMDPHELLLGRQLEW